VKVVNLLIVILSIILTSCNAYSEGPDPELADYNQLGWACEHNLWNIWIYHEAFNVSQVQAYLYGSDDELGWYKALAEVDEHHYQKRFIDVSRQCEPYDVKYILYFTDKEPEVVWMYWNESSE